MSNINIKSFDGSNYTQLLPNANQAVSSNYASSARNSDTLDGYHANQFLTENSLIPLNFLETNIGKFSNVSFSTIFSYIKNMVSFPNFGIAQLLQVYRKTGTRDFVCKYKKIIQFRANQMDAFSSYTVPSNCVIVSNSNDGNSPFGDYNDLAIGEEFEVINNRFKWSTDFLSQYYTDRQTIITVNSSKSAYMIVNQGYCDLSINQEEKNYYLFSKDSFSYSEGCFINESQKYITSNFLLDVLF